jgi:hypothetical protein
MTQDARTAFEALFGDLAPDATADAIADRATRILAARSAALSWVYRATGTYPAPEAVANRLAEVATELRDDDRDPDTVLVQEAAAALTTYRATVAA